MPGTRDLRPRLVDMGSLQPLPSIGSGLYGREWDLRRRGDRDLVDLLVLWLEPEVVHLGLPCAPYSQLGVGHPSVGDGELLAHAVSVLKKQRKAGRHATLENPVGSAVFQKEVLVGEIGPLESPKDPWTVVRTDGCQYGMVSQSLNDGKYGMPVEKGQLWASTGDMSPFSLRCKRPDALAVTEHEHRAVRGSMKVRFEDEQDHWVSSGFMSGIYTPACCEAYWHCMSQYIMTGQSDSREVVLPRGRSSGFPDSVAVVDKDPCGQQVGSGVGRECQRGINSSRAGGARERVE
eukprot:s1155_g18.t1